MDIKKCCFCGIFSPSNKECYCFLEENRSNECIKPHVDGFDHKIFKGMNTRNNLMEFSMEGFENSLGLSLHSSPIKMDSRNMEEFIMQSGSSKSTSGNRQSNLDPVLVLETNKKSGTSDFGRQEIEKGSDVKESHIVTDHKKSDIASRKANEVADCKRNGTDRDKEPAIRVVDVEVTSVTVPSGIQTQYHRRSKVKPFVCDACGKVFGLKQYLQEHKRTHTGEKFLVCQKCLKRFTHRSHLTRHLLSHTGEKPFACHTCDKRFTRKKILVAHLRIHSGEKPFTCHTCDKKFTWKTTLVAHLRIHSGGKPFACHTCDKRFRRKTTLVDHLRTHSGEKPYKCEFCGRDFSRQSSCNRHQKTKHDKT